jgi:hypothetical protein
MDIFGSIEKEEEEVGDDDDKKGGLDRSRRVGGFGDGGWVSGVENRDFEFVLR